MSWNWSPLGPEKTTAMKLNMGCGFKKLEGYLNVDREELVQPDLVADLEKTPWRWPDNTFSEVLAVHVLEHMGATTEAWLSIIREIWRVCAPDAVLRVVVPHPRNDNFLHDPTHVRIITPIGLAMFDQTRNISDFELGGSETKLGLFCGVDFSLEEVYYDLEEPWQSRMRSGQVSSEQMNIELRERNNVCSQIRMVVRVKKPQRGAAWMAEFRARHGALPGAGKGPA
jgi:predicted SAM-dependent methyltransferase